MNDTRTTENPEPRTEAGRALYENMQRNDEDYGIDAILAIEAEAATMGHQDGIAAGYAEAAQGAATLDLLRDLVQHWDAGDIDHDYDSISGAFDAARDMVRATIGLSGEHRHPEGAAPLDISCDRIVNNGMGEPTECGRSYPCDLHTEGAAPRAEGLDVERLRQHEPEPGLGLAGTSWRWDCSCGWYIEDGNAQRWWTHALSAARLAPQERRDKECVNCGVTDGHSEACVHHPDVQERLRESRG